MRGREAEVGTDVSAAGTSPRMRGGSGEIREGVEGKGKGALCGTGERGGGRED